MNGRIHFAAEFILGESFPERIAPFQAWLATLADLWTPATIFLSLLGFCVLLLVVSVWQYYYIPRLNRRLARTVAELKEANQFLESILGSSLTAIFVIGEDGRFQVKNRAGEVLAGHPMQELLGEHFSVLLPEDSKPVAEKMFRQVKTRLKPVIDRELDIVRKDGARRTILLSASPMVGADGQGYIVGTAVDITERKQAEKALQASEERYRAVVEDQTEFIARYLPGGVFTFVNDALCRHLGVPRELLVGQDFHQFMDPQDIAGLDSLLHGLTPAQPMAVYESRVLADGGEVRWHLWTNRALFDDRGRPREYQAVGRDITWRKLLEESLRAAKDEAEAASRAKSEFLANMSHEIRTPMNGIIGMTDLALASCAKTKCGTYLRMARQSASTLLSIINDILDLSKIEAGRMDLERTVFDMGQALHCTLDPLILVARAKGLALSLHIAPDVPALVRGDKGKLEQVLVNLVGNAIKFTEQGNVAVGVTLHAKAEAGQPLRLVFTVRDTGIGIPMDKLTSIFENFSQVGGSAHARYGGTGLGLAISKSLVEMMGGSIRVESEPGKGSSFFFDVVFEAAEGMEAESKPVAEPGKRMVTPRLKILLAEDNLINRMLAEELLRDRGHEVVTATNGAEAIEKARTEQPDLIIMDVRMPGMDGVEATERIRQGEAGDEVRSKPIVALTAHALKGDRERFLAAGMDEYLSKPIDLQELDLVVAKLGERQACPRKALE